MRDRRQPGAGAFLMPRISDAIAHSECATCGWPEARAHFVENGEGLVVGVTMECLACGTLEYVSHE